MDEEMISKTRPHIISDIVHKAMDEWLEISVIKNMIKNEIAPNPSTKIYTENFEILIDNYKEIASELNEYNESPKIKNRHKAILNFTFDNYEFKGKNDLY